MAQQWASLEADFQRFYGLDLRRVLWVDRVGCRRLWDLIDGLPDVSAFQRELASVAVKPEAAPKAAGWRSLARRMTGGK